MFYQTVRLWVLAVIVQVCVVQPVQAEEFSHPVFHRYNIDDGLADSAVHTVLQDNMGFMWFGTLNGLSRFDGYQFTNFTAQVDPDSLSHNIIHTLVEDRQGIIWVGTAHGLNRFNPRTENFKRYFSEIQNQHSLNANHIWFLLEDSDGELWIGTNSGLNRYRPATDDFERIALSDGKKTYAIKSIQEDQQGRLWLGTNESGILIFDKNTNHVLPLNLDIAKYPFGVKAIRGSWLDKQNRLWLATRSGLLEYHIDKEQSKLHLYHQQEIGLYSVLASTENHLWLGTEGYGLCRFTIDSRQWRCFNHRIDGFAERQVIDAYLDRQGTLWAATLTEGVISFKPDNPFRVISFDKPYNKIHDIEQDKEGRLWAATQAGVVRLDQNKKVNVYRHQADNPTGLDADNIYQIEQDNHQRLWIASAKGLHQYDESSDQILAVSLGEQQSALNHQGISGIHQMDGSEDLYLTSSRNNVLGKWQPSLQQFEALPFAEMTAQGLRSLQQFASFYDSNQRLWVLGYEYFGYLDETTNKVVVTEHSSATGKFYSNMTESAAGHLWVLGSDTLHEINHQGKIIQQFGKDYFDAGLLSAVVSVGDDLWISANNGLWRFNTKTKTTTRYNKHHGLSANDFSPAKFVDENDVIYLGGVNGITVFNPADFARITNPELTPRLTGLRINNEPVAINNSEDALLHQAISYIQSLGLSYEQSQAFSLEFSALDYFSPEATRYAYRLTGLTDKWSFTDAANRRAVYTTLPAGSYLFEVKAASVWGGWGETLQLQLDILPPWWQTYWAYAFYILSTFILLALFIRYRTSKIRQRASDLEKEVSLRTREIAKQKQTIESLLEKKNRLFANVSHELRTPLTLILGPISRLLHHAKDRDDKQELLILQRNAERLTHIVDKLLDFARLDFSSLDETKSQSLTKTVEGLYTAIQPQFSSKHIRFELLQNKQVRNGSWVSASPADALETILINLLSNAYKYTPEGGLVRLTLEQPNAQQIILKVENSGATIPEDKLQHLFERFYRMPQHAQSDIPGSGLGLALVKELVSLNQGKITVTNTAEGMVCFSLIFPCIEVAQPVTVDTPATNSWRIEDSAFALEQKQHLADIESESPEVSESNGITIDDKDGKNTILVIDDTRDMLAYLKTELAADYHVVTAINGEEGLALALEQLPDLVICDLMMPDMDGFEVLHQLRADINTSHIPFILLTAKGDSKSRIYGLQASADDYITKPFNTQVLLARIEGLLNIRRLLSKNYRKKLLSSQSPTTQNSSQLSGRDQQFLDRFNEFIVKQHHNPELNVKDIQQALHISERSLQKKIKALLGCTVVQHLRNYRLEQAVRLLKEGQMNLSNIVEASGFSSQQYFNRCFKQYFGESPLNYIKQEEI